MKWLPSTSLGCKPVMPIEDSVIVAPETPALPSALAQIYLDHHDRLFRAAYRITGSATDAEDVIQTLFLRLAGRETESGSVDNLASYVYRAAINTSLDLLRARKEGQLVPFDTAEGHPAPATPSDENPALRAQLRSALATLSPKWAEMFILKHIEGCDNGEIARVCGTSQAVVAVTLFRTRARLKAALIQSGGAP